MRAVTFNVTIPGFLIGKALGTIWALRAAGYHGERAHTFQITHDMLLQTGAPVESLVTHVFPLGEYRQALSTAANRQRTGSIKVLLDPTETPPVGVEG